MDKNKNEYYTCKRLRLLQHLKENGFTPFATIPEPNNIKYNWWLFDNTPELRECVEGYFNELKAKQHRQRKI